LGISSSDALLSASGGFLPRTISAANLMAMCVYHHVLRPLLPEKYSPLQPNGNGLQSVYLTEIPEPLAQVLMGLIGQEVAALA